MVTQDEALRIVNERLGQLAPIDHERSQKRGPAFERWVKGTCRILRDAGLLGEAERLDSAAQHSFVIGKNIESARAVLESLVEQIHRDPDALGLPRAAEPSPAAAATPIAFGPWPVVKAPWFSKDVLQYLRDFFARAYSAAFDPTPYGAMQAMAAESLRGGNFDLAGTQRSDAAHRAFPQLVEEIKRLATDGRIPPTEDGRDFAVQAVESCNAAGDKALASPAARAALDLRVFFGDLLMPRLPGGAHPLAGGTAALTIADEPFLVEMDRLVPAAAAAYRQAVEDLKAERLSYRGPANELRQALWELLDTLAPDEDVAREPGYVPQKGQTKPTHKQKAAFVMRKRHDGQVSDTTLGAIDAIAALTRETMQRTNAATHSPRDRAEAQQLQRYVEVVLRDLLR